MPSPRPRVFLSYRRADTRHAAGRAADRLADRYELFMDIDTIPPGVDFTAYLQRAVGGCDVLLAFIGEQWAQAVDETGRRRLDDPDDWVAAELATALERDVPVIPVLVDDTRLPDAAELPERLRPLLRRQAAPLRFASFSADLAHLVAAIDHVTAPAAAVAEGEPPGPAAAFADRWDQQPQPRPRTPAALAVPAARRRVAPLVVGVALALVVGGGAWAGLALRGQPAAPASPSPGPSSAVPATPEPPVPPARSVAQLKQRVPASLARTCQRLVPTDRALTSGLVVAVQCAPAKADGVEPAPRHAFYFQYADAEQAQAAFRNYYAGGPPAPGDCLSGAGEVLDDRPGGSSFGVLRCYTDADGYTVLAWIAPEQAIVASAADRDRSFTEMRVWWEGAGPTVG